MYSHDHENEIIVFAETNFRNTRQKFGIKTADRRQHIYILGKSGAGKTTLIENMILEDIYAGHGVAFVDPHGDSSEKLLDYIPSHRVNDVVYFNPADVDNPVGFNILETVDEAHKHLVAGGLMSVFKKIWEDLWSARMEYILNNAVLALLDYPGSTLLGINRLLSDKEYRQKVIANIKDPVVKAFWVKEFAGYQQKFASEAVAPIQNKVGQFLSSSIIRNVVAQVKSTIDIRKIMDEGKIFIMNLAKGRIGEDTSRLLGGMLITKLQLGAMERVDMPEKERMDFYLYVDEFQNFATGNFAEILSEARKYRLNLILAHQYIMQLDEKVRDGVFGNVGTHIIFRVGAADAAAFEEEFAPVFVPEDLVNLANYDIYLKLLIDGAASAPFSATTLPPIGSPTGSRDNVIKVSRERYSEKRSVIEEKIERWWGFGEDEGLPPLEKEGRGGFFGSPPARLSREASAKWEGGVRGGGSYESSRPLSSRPSPSGSFERQRQTTPIRAAIPPPPAERPYLFPVTCSRCHRETSSRFKPDPRKPFYCEDCLPVMREKIRLQSSSPPPARGGVRGGGSYDSSPFSKGGSAPVRGGDGGFSKSSIVNQKSKIPSPGLSLSALTPRPPKSAPALSSPPLKVKGERGSYESDSRPSPPKIRE